MLESLESLTMNLVEIDPDAEKSQTGHRFVRAKNDRHWTYSKQAHCLTDHPSHEAATYLMTHVQQVILRGRVKTFSLCARRMLHATGQQSRGTVGAMKAQPMTLHLRTNCEALRGPI